MTSFASSWINQRVNLRVQLLATARKQRETLYVDFVKEASRLYADALTHERDEINEVVNLYAIVAHLRMVSSPRIIGCAEDIIGTVVAAYGGPTRALSDLRSIAASGGFDTFQEFGRACRAELSRFRTEEPLPGEQETMSLEHLNRAEPARRT